MICKPWFALVLQNMVKCGRDMCFLLFLSILPFSHLGDSGPSSTSLFFSLLSDGAECLQEAGFHSPLLL